MTSLNSIVTKYFIPWFNILVFSSHQTSSKPHGLEEQVLLLLKQHSRIAGGWLQEQQREQRWRLRLMGRSSFLHQGQIHHKGCSAPAGKQQGFPWAWQLTQLAQRTILCHLACHSAIKTGAWGRKGDICGYGICLPLLEPRACWSPAFWEAVGDTWVLIGSCESVPFPILLGHAASAFPIKLLLPMPTSLLQSSVRLEGAESECSTGWSTTWLFTRVSP